MKDSNTNTCEHDKEYDSYFLLSNPPHCKWRCKKCGVEGYDVVGADLTNETKISRSE